MQRLLRAASHAEVLDAAGRVLAYPARTFVPMPGQPMDRFIYIEDNEMEVINSFTGEHHLPSMLGSIQFLGKISLFNGGAWSMSMGTVRNTRVIEVPREAMLTLMPRIAEMSEIIVTVLVAPSRRQIVDRNSSLPLIGEH